MSSLLSLCRCVVFEVGCSTVGTLLVPGVLASGGLPLDRLLLLCLLGSPADELLLSFDSDTVHRVDSFWVRTVEELLPFLDLVGRVVETFHAVTGGHLDNVLQ